MSLSLPLSPCFFWHTGYSAALYLHGGINASSRLQHKPVRTGLEVGRRSGGEGCALCISFAAEHVGLTENRRRFCALWSLQSRWDWNVQNKKSYLLPWPSVPALFSNAASEAPARDYIWNFFPNFARLLRTKPFLATCTQKHSSDALCEIGSPFIFIFFTSNVLTEMFTLLE